jgi:hypothetical protein
VPFVNGSTGLATLENGHRIVIIAYHDRDHDGGTDLCPSLAARFEFSSGPFVAGGEVLVLTIFSALFPCSTREDRRHQLRWSLAGACRLASQLAIDRRGQRYPGDDKRTRQHQVGKLLLQDRIELPYATPLLGG